MATQNKNLPQPTPCKHRAALQFLPHHVCALGPTWGRGSRLRSLQMTTRPRSQGWHHAWAFSTAKLGYSGVSVHTRSPPLSVVVGLGHGGPGAADPDPEHEGEGRVVTVELEGLFLVNVYVPNSGEVRKGWGVAKMVQRSEAKWGGVTSR